MSKAKFISDSIISFVRARYEEEITALHRPVFEANEREYLIECIDSNFVLSVGAQVTEFEKKVANFCGAAYGVATVN